MKILLKATTTLRLSNCTLQPLYRTNSKIIPTQEVKLLNRASLSAQPCSPMKWLKRIRIFKTAKAHLVPQLLRKLDLRARIYTTLNRRINQAVIKTCRPLQPLDRHNNQTIINSQFKTMPIRIFKSKIKIRFILIITTPSILNNLKSSKETKNNIHKTTISNHPIHKETYLVHQLKPLIIISLVKTI